MGRASNRKKHKRDERAAEAQMLRIVVCAYPDKSLLPVLDLLKAATIYGDEVVLHHPTATMLGSIAALGQLEPADLVSVMRTLAPSLGEQGASFEQAVAKLESDHGEKLVGPLFGALLDPASSLHQVLRMLGPTAAEAV